MAYRMRVTEWVSEVTNQHRALLGGRKVRQRTTYTLTGDLLDAAGGRGKAVLMFERGARDADPRLEFKDDPRERIRAEAYFLFQQENALVTALFSGRAVFVQCDVNEAGQASVVVEHAPVRMAAAKPAAPAAEEPHAAPPAEPAVGSQG